MFKRKKVTMFHELEKAFLQCDGKSTKHKGKAELKDKPQTGKK